ncbi:hypothetical protein [Azospirillum argentinense]
MKRARRGRNHPIPPFCYSKNKWALRRTNFLGGGRGDTHSIMRD